MIDRSNKAQIERFIHHNHIFTLIDLFLTTALTWTSQ